MGRFLKLGLLGLSFLISSYQVFGQTVVGGAHETLDQRTIVIRFSGNLSGPASTIADWGVFINTAPVTVTSVTPLGLNSVVVRFQASDVHAGQNFLLPTEVLTFTFTNNSGVLSGGVAATGPGNPYTSINNWKADCSDVAFLNQGLITLPVAKSPDQCSPVVEDFTQYLYYLSLRVRNSIDWSAAGGGFYHQMNWGDGTGVTNELSYLSDGSGVPNAAFYDQTAFGAGQPGVIMTTRPTHNYPATLPATGGDCSWNATVTPALAFATFTLCTGLTKQTIYASYDTDNKNTGLLNLPPSPLPTSNLVCLGSNLAVKFSDNTNLNCRTAVEPLVPNQQARAVRFTYGSRDNGGLGNIPDVWITLPPGIYGVQPSIQITNNNATGTRIFPAGYFPTNLGPSDANGVITLPAAVTVATALTYAAQIFTTDPANQAVTQRFYVKMEYWDVCNPYDQFTPASLALAESIENFAEVVTRPVPPGVVVAPLCETTASGTTYTATPAGNTYTWYKDAALTIILQGPSADDTFNPFTEGPVGDRINPAVTGSTTFHRYVTQTVVGALSCTSLPTDIVIQIDDTNTPGSIAHPLGASPFTICSGTDPVSFTSVDATGGGPGGTVTYQWQSATNAAFTTGLTNVGTNSNLFDPPALAAGIFYRRQASSGTCAGVTSNSYEFRINTAVVPGVIDNPQTLCNGVTNPAAMTSTTAGSGGTGTPSYTWQFSIDNFGADINTIPGATLATYDPPAALTVTTYYRRVNTSGVCVPGSVASNVVIMTVNDAVVPGSIGNPQTICSGQDPGVLTETGAPSGGNGTTYTFQWQESATGGGVGFAAATGGNTGATYDPPVLTATKFYRRRVTSGVCAATFSNEIQVTVNPLPTASNPTGGGAVCSGNPAPDIVWNLPTGLANFQISYTITKNPGAVVTPVGPIVETTNVFTIASPNPVGIAGDTFDYKLTSIVDANGCSANAATLAAVLSRQVSIGGTAPSFDAGPTLDISFACQNGVSTTNPTFSAPGTFSLDPGSANSVAPHFTLTYKIDGGANRTKVFATNAAGDPTAPISFSDVELDVTGAHTISLVSLVSPTACQTVLPPINLPFTVRALPVINTQPSNATVCAGLNTSFSAVVAAGTDQSLQWQEKVGAGPFTDLTNTGVYSGVTTNTLTLTGVPIGMSTNQYQLVVKNFNPPSTTPACQTISTARTLTVNPLPTANDQTPAVCSDTGAGTTATVNLTSQQTAINGTAGHTYLWFTGYNPATKVFSGAILPATSVLITGGTPVFCQVTRTLTGCVSPATVTYTVNPTADITVQPANTAVCVGDNATFTVTATGPAIAYKWQENGVNITDGGIYSGSTTATLTLTGVTATQNGKTYRVVTTTTGPCPLNSSAGTLTVNPLPVVSSPAQSLCSDIPGGTTKVTNLQSVNASIHALAGTTFAWFQAYNPGTKVFSSPIGGAETAYNVTDGESLFVKVTTVATSCVNVATINFTVHPTPVANPITGPTNTCVDATSIVVYQVAQHAGSTYAWTIPTGAGQFVKAAGGGINDFFVLLQFPNAVPTPGLAMTVVETNAGCPGALQSLSVIVDSSPPSINIVGPATVCSGDAGVVYSVALLANTTYAWTVPIGASIIGGQGSESITVNFGSISGNVAVTPSTTSGCAGTPDSQPVVVNQRPDLSNSLDRSVCSKDIAGITLATETFSPAAASTYNITSVTFSVPGITPIVGPTSGNALLANAIFNDKYENKTGGPIQVRYTVVPVSIDGCQGLPAEIVTLTVNPEPVLSSALDKTVCSKGASGITLAVATGSFPATTYNITINNNGLVPSAGAPVNGTGFNAGEISNDAWINNTALPVDVLYTVRPVSTAPFSCIGDPVIVKLTVTPEPVGNAIPKVARCSDNDVLGVAYTLSSSTVAATGFTIVTNSNGLIQSAGTVSSGTNKSATELIDDAWTNTGLNPVDVDYTITPFNGLCSGASFVVSVTINPEPVGTPIVQVTRCSDVALGVSYNLSTSGTSVAASSYNITVASGGLVFSGATPITPTGNAAGTLADDSWTNTTGAAVVVTYTVTPMSGANCLGNPYDVSVSIDPEPTGVAIPKVARCSDTDVLGVAYTLSTSGVTATSYTIATTSNGLTQSAGTVSAGANKSATELIDDAWTNTGTVAVDVDYLITPFNGACAGTPYTVSVTIRPEPVGVAITQVSRCSDIALGAAYNLTTTGTSAPVSSYNITVNSNGLTFSGATAITPTGNAAGTLADDSWTNTTSAAVIVTYTVTPVSGLGCLGNPYSVTVSIDPEPTGIAIPKVARCSDNDVLGVAYTLSTSGVTATTYTIATNSNGLTQSAGTVSAGASKTATELIDDAWNNVGTNPVDVDYTITPFNGTCAGTPYTVSVTINPEPVGVAIAQVTRCSDTALGVAYNLTTTGTSVPVSTFNITVNSNGLTFSGATPITPTGNAANTLADDSWTNTTAAAVLVTYAVTPVSAAGCRGNSYNVTVSIDPEPTGIAIPKVTRCSDTDVLGVAYTLSTSGVTATSYTIATNSNGLTQSAGTVSAGTNKTATELIDDAWNNVGPIAVDVDYTITPLNGTCAGTPYTVSVTINPEPVGTAIVQVTRCSDTALGAAYNLTTAGTSVAAGSYNITVNSNGLVFSGLTAITPTGNAAGTLTDDSWTNTTAAPVLVTYTVTPVSAAGCLGNAYSVSVSIDPEPTGNAIPKVTRCSDNDVLGVAYTLSTSGVTATSYTISTNSNGLVQSAGTVSAGTGKSATELNDDAWTNTGLNPVDVDYLITPMNGTCAGTPYTVSVTIRPEPVGTPIVQVSRCSQALLGAAYNLSSNGASVAATSYNIAVNPNGLTFSGATPAAATGNSFNILADDRWTNTGLFPVVVTYTVTPVSATGCLGNPYAVTVSIDPEPVGSNVVATRCSDESFGGLLILSTSGASVPASTFNISVNSNGLIFSGATPASATGNSAGILTDDKWTNTTSLPVDVVYTVVPVSGGSLCTGGSFLVTVTINPEPIGSPDLPLEVCSRDALNFNLQTIINNTYPGGNTVPGNSVVSNFRYSVTSSPPAAGVSPGPNRNVSSSANITDTYVNTSNVDATITYTVIPSSAGGSCDGTPFDFKVLVHPEPVGVDLTVPLCNTTLNHDIQTQISNALPSVFTYVITQSPLGALTLPPNRVVASNAFISDVYTNTTGGPVTVTYTISAFNSAHPVCTGAATFKYVVTISPNPIGITDTKPARCSDEVFTLDPQLNISPSVASTFTWTLKYDGVTVPPGGSGVITTSFTNTSNAPKNAVYHVTPTAVGSGCTGAPFDITIPINPEPVMKAALATPASICSTNPISTNPTNVVLDTNGVSIAAGSYMVTLKSQDAGLVGTPTTGTFAAAGGISNAIKNDTYRNTTAAALKVVYTVVPISAANCSGDPFDITVTVLPEPVLASPALPAVCSTNTVNQYPVNVVLGTNGVSVAAASYTLLQIQYSTGGPFSTVVPVGITPASTNAAVSSVGNINLLKDDKYTNKLAVSLTVRYTVQGKAPGSTACLSESLNYDVVISPEPTLDPALNPTPVCSGVISGVTLAVAPGSVAATSYNIKSITLVPPPPGQPALVAGPSNSGIGSGKTASAIFNDVYVNTSNGPLSVIYAIEPVTGSCNGPEAVVTLTINPSPEIADNLGKTVCTGTASGITLTTKGTSVAASNYNIISMTPAGALVANGGNVAVPASAVAAGYLSGHIFSNPTNNPLIVTYRVEPRSGLNCLGPQKDIILTVEPTISASSTINHKAAICSTSGNGTDPTDIELLSPTVPTAGVITFNYTAVSSLGTQINGFTPALSSLASGYHINDNLVNNSNTAAGAFVTYTITPVANGARGGLGCTGPATVKTVNVEPKPKLTVSSSIKTICEGPITANSSTNISLSSPTVPSTGTIEYLLVSAVATGGVTGMTANGTVFPTTSVLNDVLDNPTTSMQSVVYTLRPRMNAGSACIGDDVTVTINVNPKPNLVASPQAPICNGDLIDIQLTSDVVSSTTVSTWTTTAPATVTGATSGGGDRIFNVLFNTGNVVETVTYKITPNASGCIGPDLFINVQVSPKAKVLGVPSSPNPIICHGNSLNIPLSSNVLAGVTYSWDIDNSANSLPGIPASGSGNPIFQPMINTTGSQATITYNIHPVGPGPGAGCPGEDKIMIVTVSPEITASFLNTPPNEDFICKNSPEFLIFNFGGRAPFEFSYNDGGPAIVKSGQPPVAVYSHTPLTTKTYTITSVKDGLGCILAPISVQYKVNVLDTDPNWTIISPAAACNPNTVVFQYNQVAGTNYKWNFPDKTPDPDSSYNALTTVPNMIIKHVFSNETHVSTLTYPVQMSTSLPNPFTPPGPDPVCPRTTPAKNITIYPTLSPVVLADKMKVCNGEIIRFSAATPGATVQTWSYRILGSGATPTVFGSGSQASHVFTNTTTTNPLLYEVLYDATNGNCPAPQQAIQPIEVYISADAQFNVGTVPLFIGQSDVVFTNVSNPLDAASVDYFWDFGSDATPGSFTGITPPTITYVRPGFKEVTLTAQNKLNGNGTCKSSISHSFTIKIPPLSAVFTASPIESCFPTKIFITAVDIRGDTYEWKVIDQNFRTAATSTGYEPTFNLPSEGTYTINLKVSNSLTGQDTLGIPQVVKVYPRPFASFDARPDVVYVPDTEVITYNFSTGANQYLWDFGDGSTSIDEEPKYVYKIEGIYDMTLTAQFDHGGGVVCSDKLSREIIAKQGGVTKVPNAFTPNPNGPNGGRPDNGTFNDVFLPIVKGAEEFSLQIYDRWGNLIFESNRSDTGWDGYNIDGKLLPAGVYVYKLTIRLSDGQRSTQLGDVTMIR